MLYDRCDAARPGTLASKGEVASLSCRDVAEPSLLGEGACSPREDSLSISTGTGVSSPLRRAVHRPHAWRLWCCRSLIYRLFAPPDHGGLQTLEDVFALVKPVKKRDTYITLDDPTRVPQMLAVRDPRVDERPVDG